MTTLSIDLRERVLAAYDAGEGTREEIANRFRVSLGMVKKLLQQRRATGCIAPRHKNSGCKPKITLAHRQHLAELVHQQPDMTLEELREAIGVACTVPAIHYVLKGMGLSYKKRHSNPPSRIEPT